MAGFGFSFGAYPLIEEAIEFAAQAHEGEHRKGGGVPYIAHPMEAMMIVSTLTDDPEVIAAAILHDVVEDTDFTLEDIEEAFGERVAGLVAHESENKRPDLPKAESWRIRKEEQLAAIADAPIEAKMIMLGDKLSNIRASLRDYNEIGDAMWEKFNMKEKAQQEWYFRTIAERLADLEEYPAYQEYRRCVDYIFG